VWPTGSADTVCPRPPLLTQVSILFPELRRDETYRRCELNDLDLWPVTDAGRRPPPRRPSLKFVGLAIRKIKCTMCVSALTGLVNLTFDILTLKPVYKSYLRWGKLPSKFGHASFSNYSLCTRRTDRQIDGRTKATLIAPSLWSGHNNPADRKTIKQTNRNKNITLSCWWM